jgi:hypothetical protein
MIHFLHVNQPKVKKKNVKITEKRK